MSVCKNARRKAAASASFIAIPGRPAELKWLRRTAGARCRAESLRGTSRGRAQGPSAAASAPLLPRPRRHKRRGEARAALIQVKSRPPLDPASNSCYSAFAATPRSAMLKPSPNAKKPKKARSRVHAKLQWADLRKSARKRNRARKPRTTAQLKLQDAFDFLGKLKPGSVDLIISSPPYCMGKEYDTSISVEDFKADHQRLAPLLVRALKNGGSLCWQVGHHVQDGTVTPLDALVYPIFAAQEDLYLRNRIVWTFGHGVHAKRRFSGRHETILWFTKGRRYRFNLNAVRVPQKYPGKRHYKGPKKGQFSGNPRGKNPSDVWEIPNVKSRHIEKTAHPCQFPIALVQRLIRALVRPKGLVVDPFMGSGSAAVAAALEGRRFAGCDISASYVEITRARLTQLKNGNKNHRPLEKPIFVPRGTEAVATRPPHFWITR